MADIDFEKVIAEVAKRHQILLRKDDPAFAIITLNQLVFETVTEEMFKKVRGLTAEFKAAADQVQTCAGAAIAREIRTAIESGRASLRADLEAGKLQAKQMVMELQLQDKRARLARYITVGLLAAVALLVCGALLGRLML